MSKHEKEIKKLLKKKIDNVEPQFKIGSLRYDFYLKDYNALVEYNGDYWHCNPQKYAETYFNLKKRKYAFELWEYDEKKKQLAIDNGYKFFVIWESDYMKDKKNTIKNLLEDVRK